MSGPGLAKLAASFAGVAVFVALFIAIGGTDGLVAGSAGAGASWWLGERYWRRKASAGERRAELEDRVQNQPS